MLRRIWNAIVDGFTPHPECFQDSAELPFSAATVQAPMMAAPVQAAKIVSDETDDR